LGPGYWSHAPAGRNTANTITIDPKSNTGDRAEVSVKVVSGGQPVGSGPGGSAVADVEIRYALGRGDCGLYTYSVFDHKPDYPATSVGEARFCAKLNDAVFDWMTVGVPCAIVSGEPPPPRPPMPKKRGLLRRFTS